MSDYTNDDTLESESIDVTQNVDPTSHSSTTWKVLGKIDAPTGTGILGHNTATSGSPIGAEGVVDTKKGSGVRGTNTANADTANDIHPKGVRGRATGTGPTFAVYGRGTSAGAKGLVGDATTDGNLTFSDGYPTGVVGITDRSGADSGVNESYGILGAHLATSGSGIGIVGATGSTSSGAYGVYSDGDSRTSGNHEVTGSVEAFDRLKMGNVGAEVYRGSDQTVPVGTETRVKFDKIGQDDANEYDDTNYEFVCKDAGSYHVDVQLNWNGDVPSDTHIVLKIRVSSEVIARYETNTGGIKRQITHSISRAAHGVRAGDNIRVTVEQNSGGDLDINGLYNHLTYMTVSYLG